MSRSTVVKTVSPRAGPKAAASQFRVSPARVDDLRDAGFSAEELHEIVAPRRTLSRRRERNEPLTAIESDRVIRLERISEMAERIFGNREKARRWLRSEIAALDGARPIELLQSETGAHIVEDELVRIDHGIFA